MVTTDSLVRPFLDAAPAAVRVTVADAGHMVPITHPEPVSRALLRFLALQNA